jgi:AhpD family alkylhydroperoxidase
MEREGAELVSTKARVKPPASNREGSRDPIRGSALAHQPEALDAFTRLYAVLWSHGVLDHPTKELARLRNARVTGCGFCRNVRFSAAREQGLTEEMVEQIREGYAESDLSPRQKLVLRYTDAMLSTPPEVSEALRVEMVDAFSAAEIVELTAAIGLFLGFSKIAVSLGGVPDEMPVTILPTPA